MMTIIFLIVVLASLAFFVSGGILTWITRLFKVENVSFKKSLLILFFSGVIGLVARLLFGAVDLGMLSSVIAIIVTFISFHFLINKYYETDWKKSLAMYGGYSVFTFMLMMLIAFPVRMFIVQPFIVRGDSMSPLYNDGDYLLINRLQKTYQRNDVIVALIPKRNDAVIKRVIGLPGEKLKISDGKVFINGKDLNVSDLGSFNADINLAEDEYYILGDNAVKSYDSRAFGPIKKSDIIGKIFYSAQGLMVD